MRRLGWATAVVFVLIGLGTLLPRPFLSDVPNEPLTRRILLLSNPIHTDIAIPVDDALLREFDFLSNSGLPLDAPGLEYIIFGWGGRAFYLETPNWSDLKAGPLLKGLTLDQAAMHVSLSGEIAGGDAATPLTVGEGDYVALLDYIRASFRENEGGQPMLIAGSGYGDYDIFYEAKGRFTALLGCNSWTAAALRAAGLRTGVWNPLPVLLRTSLRLYAR